MIKQKIIEYNIGSRLDAINTILAEGYEISDITPILQASGGGISSRVHGLYTLKVLFILSASEKRSNVAMRLCNNSNDNLQNLNQILNEENEKGAALFKIIPNNAFIDPEAHSGIGKGTYGFCLFFIKAHLLVLNLF